MRKNRLALVFFGIFFGLIMLDISRDILAGGRISELLEDIVIETLIILSASISGYILFSKYFEERERRLKSGYELEAIKLAQATSLDFSKEKLKKSVIQTFSHWSLSNSEQEIAMLILEGHDLQKIADFRHTSEKTVRNQAQSIYDKSKLSGRAELAGHFLKEFIL